MQTQSPAAELALSRGRINQPHMQPQIYLGHPLWPVGVGEVAAATRAARLFYIHQTFGNGSASRLQDCRRSSPKIRLSVLDRDLYGNACGNVMCSLNFRRNDTFGEGAFCRFLCFLSPTVSATRGCIRGPASGGGILPGPAPESIPENGERPCWEVCILVLRAAYLSQTQCRP